ncbi:MIR motif-containing protein [Ochromonadaceae sp. CCMP2298]|nr:MIR motif-containing protein [Ochromonadaceae sp. CCMP2298]
MTVLPLLLVVLAMALLQLEAGKEGNDPVTCGSVIKLVHKETGNNLHSHGISWGSGSGQQSVTTNSVNNDKGSLWLIKEASTSSICEIGTPLKCGDSFRLEHADSKKNLHSHLFQAPLSGGQEVSGFGDEQGNGDTGDNWTVQCESSDAVWMRHKSVYLRHVDTGMFLSSSQSFQFNQQNCGGNCPIMAQTEVSASAKRDGRTKWSTGQGVYYPSKMGREEEDEL